MFSFQPKSTHNHNINTCYDPLLLYMLIILNDAFCMFQTGHRWRKQLTFPNAAGMTWLSSENSMQMASMLQAWLQWGETTKDSWREQDGRIRRSDGAFCSWKWNCVDGSYSAANGDARAALTVPVVWTQLGTVQGE